MIREELTDEQWALVAPLLPAPPRRDDRRGRPWRDAREVLSATLWVLRRGAHWRDLPAQFPPHQTCRRRFRQWTDDGTLRLVLEALAEDLSARGGLDITECLPDDTLTESDAAVARGGDARPCAGDARAGAGGARANVPWQRRTAELFLSRATRRLLRRTGSPLARKLP